MKFLDREFEYGGTIEHLDKTKGNYEGVYIIVQPKTFGKVVFNENHYKAKCKRKDNEEDLNYTLKDLERKWVNDAEVLYIGKSESKTVQKLMIKHIKLYSWDDEHNGYNNVPARGGRSIGQIQNYEKLEVWYLKCDNPTEMKEKLLQDFKKQYKKLPFANLKG